jgi:hypothetical protein
MLVGADHFRRSCTFPMSATMVGGSANLAAIAPKRNRWVFPSREAKRSLSQSAHPHIRTNAFMIRRELFLSLHPTRFKRKSDVYRFESGRRSMTKQITALGMTPVVVDRFGTSYRLQDWKRSSTFWTDDQANLLIADKQTREYAAGSAEHHMIFENYAWNPPSSWVGQCLPMNPLLTPFRFFT